MHPNRREYYSEIKNIRMRTRFTYLAIIIFVQFGFSQEEHKIDSNTVFQLNINDGGAITAILKYELGDPEQVSLTFHTIKMRKKFFTRDFKKVKTIKSSKEIKLTHRLKQILFGERLLTLCQNEEDMTGKQFDGVYFYLQINRMDGIERKECSVLVDSDITSKEDSAFGKMLNEILDEIQYAKLDKEFKGSLKRGYYFYGGSYYLIIR